MKTTGTSIRCIFYFKQPGKTAWSREIVKFDAATGTPLHAHKSATGRYQVYYSNDGKPVYQNLDGVTAETLFLKFREIQVVTTQLAKTQGIEQRSAGRPKEGIAGLQRNRRDSHVSVCVEKFLRAKEQCVKGGVKSSSYANAKSVMDAFESVCKQADIKFVRDVRLEHIQKFTTRRVPICRVIAVDALMNGSPTRKLV